MSTRRIRRHLCRGLLILAGATAIGGLLASPALAAKPSSPGGGHGGGGGGNGGGGSKGGGGGGSSSSTTGYDISYPQCNSSLPTGQAFGIVGVNGGLANDANGCLGSQLLWALGSPGLSSPFQPPVSLYMNTADPGPAPGVSDWPSTGSDSYGTCAGGWTAACAYLYGQQRASYSFGLVDGIYPGVATGSPWWLDIETANSWATNTTPNYTTLNIAAIRGFIDGLTTNGAGAPVGIYSTAGQWNQITGLTSQTTAGALGSSPPDWVAGARSLKRARSNCTGGGFTGAAPTLAQYSSGGYDADLRCG